MPVSVSGDVLAREGEREGSRGHLCHRCGRDPQKAHDRAFCPAFAQYGESGRWLDFSAIRRALERRSGKTLRVVPSNRIEEHDGPFGQWHRVVGLYRDRRYLGRFDYPNVPEFSLWGATRYITDDRGTRPGVTPHPMLYKGWRSSLRQACALIDADWRKVAADLGISPDRSTEEILRFKSGYL